MKITKRHLQWAGYILQFSGLAVYWIYPYGINVLTGIMVIGLVLLLPYSVEQMTNRNKGQQ